MDKNKLNDWLHSGLDNLFGDPCALCQARAAAGLGLCRGCWVDLPWLDSACCACALALPASARGDVCSTCARQPRFDAAVAALAYVEPVRWLIAGLKYRARRHHARPLACALADRITAAGTPRPHALVPVPLHAGAYRRRGFNQAEQIAGLVGQQLGITLAHGLVWRARAGAAQRELAADQRAANVRGAFTVRGRPELGHVAIVDDVVTTTHTAAALARALRDAGAKRVDVYCVARA